ncbi:MAG: BrnT family toxin, partial [Patescibacteria group bacterium]
ERMLHITFTYHSKKIRVISARDMSKKERIEYEEFKKRELCLTFIWQGRKESNPR